MNIYTTKRANFILHLLISAILLLSPLTSSAEQVPGLVHLHTDFSPQGYPLMKLVRLASERDIGVMVITDQAIIKAEYGLFPLRGIAKKVVGMTSILGKGPERYLDIIRRAREEFPEVVIVPGTEVAPFYFWEGHPLKGDLVFNHWHKHFLAIGLEEAGDYRGLPILGNKDGEDYYIFSPWLLWPLLILVAGIMLLVKKRNKTARYTGLFLLLFSGIYLVNNYPFRIGKFNPYNGDYGPAPYQTLIDYVNARGGVVSIAHPEAKGLEGLGDVSIHTPPYPEALILLRDYTSFAALYGDTITAIEPGREWDIILKEYLEGKRPAPVWGDGQLDFHTLEDVGGVPFPNIQTVFLLEERSPETVIKAIKSGRMYAVWSRGGDFLTLDSFCVELSGRCSDEIESGFERRVEDKPKLRIGISSRKNMAYGVKVRLIKNGIEVKAWTDHTPFNLEYTDSTYSQGERSYYRLDVKGSPPMRLVANPIFVVSD